MKKSLAIFSILTMWTAPSFSMMGGSEASVVNDSIEGPISTTVKFGEFEGQQRPQAVQHLVDHTFQTLEPKTSAWGLDGDIASINRIAEFNEAQFALKLIKESPVGTQLSFLDYGAGKYGWNMGMRSFLEQSDVQSLMKEKNLHIHLVGVGAERGHDIKCSDTITDYRLGSMKIENLREALNAQEALKDMRFDFITARWSLRHLVDPLGSFKECVDALKPNGFFAFQGFFMLLNAQRVQDAFGVMRNIKNMLSVLELTGCDWLWIHNQEARNIGDGLLQNTVSNPSFPFTYGGGGIYIGDSGAQVGCKLIQEYKSLDPLPDVYCEGLWEHNTVVVSESGMKSGFLKAWQSLEGEKKFGRPLSKWNIIEGKRLP